MKQCFKCNAIKPLDDFYKHPEMIDGHVNKTLLVTQYATKGYFLNRAKYAGAGDGSLYAG